MQNSGNAFTLGASSTGFWHFAFGDYDGGNAGSHTFQVNFGNPAFTIALCFIGGVTAIVGEVAGMLGCVIGLPDSVTAITLVALGTSLPDTFASMTAAKQSDNAHSAVVNLTGSNTYKTQSRVNIAADSAEFFTQDDSNPAHMTLIEIAA